MDFYLNIGDIYALLAAFCWSSGVILFDLSGKEFNSLQINLLKNIIGLFCFVIVLFFTGNLFSSYTNKEYQLLIISAILGVAIGDLFLLHSLRRLGAGLYAIVGTSYILFVFITAFILYGETIPLQVALGAILVISAIIIRSKSMMNNSKNKLLFSGIACGLIAQGLTAYSVLLIRPIMELHHVIHIAMIRFGIGVLFNMIHVSFSSGFLFIKETFIKGFSSPKMVLGAFMGTFLSVIFWLSGFKYTLAARAAIYNQLSTILITIMAAIFLKEKMNLANWFAVVIACIGAMIVSII